MTFITDINDRMAIVAASNGVTPYIGSTFHGWVMARIQMSLAGQFAWAGISYNQAKKAWDSGNAAMVAEYLNSVAADEFFGTATGGKDDPQGASKVARDAFIQSVINGCKAIAASHGVPYAQIEPFVMSRIAAALTNNWSIFGISAEQAKKHWTALNVSAFVEIINFDLAEFVFKTVDEGVENPDDNPLVPTQSLAEFIDQIVTGCKSIAVQHNVPYTDIQPFCNTRINAAVAGQWSIFGISSNQAKKAWESRNAASFIELINMDLAEFYFNTADSGIECPPGYHLEGRICVGNDTPRPPDTPTPPIVPPTPPIVPPIVTPTYNNGLFGLTGDPMTDMVITIVKIALVSVVVVGAGYMAYAYYLKPKLDKKKAEQQMVEAKQRIEIQMMMKESVGGVEMTNLKQVGKFVKENPELTQMAITAGMGAATGGTSLAIPAATSALGAAGGGQGQITPAQAATMVPMGQPQQLPVNTPTEVNVEVAK